MKQFFFSILVFSIFSCGNTKQTSPDVSDKSTMEQTNIDAKMNPLINDIWVAETIFGERFEPNGDQLPTLEIHIKDNRLAGNNGCNTIGGSIKKLDNENIAFGNVVSTRMLCPDMMVPDQFDKAISQTKKYKIQKLRLYLMNEEGEDLMVLRKVD